ncbi:fasciclin domain-containing protein [Paradesertivirga mongoliensis]|uniref:Fasciclin domain-containing protein n=1 Tax=Paradesertivirga mongoliensis TaxID=2100740 RepID=A0ABW4ZLH0_9SPHI|nr:fasciclin domain-containing protein [Pedobacter mongoliensis]
MKNIITTLALLKNRSRSALSILSVLIVFSACEEQESFSFQELDRQKMMLEEIKQDTSLSIAIQALEKAKIAPILNTYGPFTFFAPDNTAFRKYIKARGKNSIDDFTEAELKTLMVYHILQARLKAPDFIQGPQVATTGNKDYISIDVSKGFKTTATANGKALIYKTDIEFANGYVHKMDGVLDPPTLTIGQFLLANQSQYSILIGGLQRAGLMDTLTNLENDKKERIRLTLFAETNEVLQKAGITTFDDLPLDELKWKMRYHIIRGGNFSSSYSTLRQGFPSLKHLAGWDSTITTLNGQEWIYFNLADKKLMNNATIDFAASDVIMRNGVLHNLDNRLVFNPGIKRTQIMHVFKNADNYAYGIPNYVDGARAIEVGGTNWRITADGFNHPKGRPNIKCLFAFNDNVGDSIVTIVRGVKKGKYKFEMNFKGGNRSTAQLMHGMDNIGVPTSYSGPPEWDQNLYVGEYEFQTSGDKRIKWVMTTSGRFIGLETMLLTPVY